MRLHFFTDAGSFYFCSSLPIRGQLRRTDNLPLFYLLFISVKPYPVPLAIRKQGKPASVYNSPSDSEVSSMLRWGPIFL